MKNTFLYLVCACLTGLTALSQQAVNQDALTIQDFENRIDAYMKVHNAAAAALPRLKPTDSSEMIAEHERKLAHRIREMHADAKQGDIFTPEISALFKRLVAVATQGDGARISKSLKHAEPVAPKIHINGTYPPGVPLQSMPPSLIVNLPKLPMELEYRIVGHDLVLRDKAANLVIDYIPGAIPV